MFADPQSITVSGVATSLVRTNSTSDGGTFADPTRSYELSARHAYGRRTRHMFKISRSHLTADPLVPSQNIKNQISCHIVVDTPPGYPTADAKALVDALLANLSASSGLNVTKLVGGES